MKMRKIISFVLVLALVLGSFSMAFAATPATTGLSDIAGIANEDAIQVNNDLGIIAGYPDGTFGPEKAVTRAEFAAMITRALAIPESALAGYSAASFKDMTGYGWATGYIGFCASKGIMLGDGAGNAMPARTINTNEAMTMVLRAIGYVNNSAELVGTWPANYVTVAQNVGLYDDVAAVANVDRANAAQIIYNALTVQKVSVNTDGDTKFLTTGKDDEEVNLLNSGLGCDTDADTIITGTDYDNAVMNITKYMGAYGTAYTNDDGDIVAFTVDSTSLTGSFDGNKFKVGDVKYTLGDNTYTTTKAIANTVVETTAGGMNVTGKLDKTKIEKFASDFSDNDVTINVDLSGNTIKDIYSVVGWYATDADTVSKSDVTGINEDKELLSSEFDKNDNDNIDLASFELVGVTNLDKIATDNVVYVYSDGDYIRKVAVGTETVTGNVTEIEDGDHVVVNSKEYEPAGFATEGLNKTQALPELDDDTILSLDAFGYIFDFDSTAGTPDNYAVVKVFAPANGVDNAKTKLYTSDDATKTFTFADDADMSFTPASNTMVSTAGLTVGKLIGYGLDSDGVLDTLDSSSKVAPVSANLQSTKVIKIDGSSYDVDSDVVVFTYKTSTSAIDDYDIIKVADLITGDIMGAGFSYILNDDQDTVLAMLVSDEFNDNGTDDTYAVLNSANKVKDGDDTVKKLVGFSDGKAYSALTDKESTFTGNIVDAPKLFRFELSGTGTIKLVQEITSGAIDDEAVQITTGIVTKGGMTSDDTVINIGVATDDKYTAQSDAVVYQAVMTSDGTEVDYYVVASLSSIGSGDKVYLYDTKTGDDHDGIANVVIFVDKDDLI